MKTLKVAIGTRIIDMNNQFIRGERLDGGRYRCITLDQPAGFILAGPEATTMNLIIFALDRMARNRLRREREAREAQDNPPPPEPPADGDGNGAPPSP